MSLHVRLASCLTVAVLAACGGGRVFAASEFVGTPTWEMPQYSKVRTALLAWLDSQNLEAAKLNTVAAEWPENTTIPAAQLLERVVKVFGVAHEPTRKLKEVCSRPAGDSLPDTEWLYESEADPFLRVNVRLFYGRWLTQQRLFDEASVALKDLKPEDVVDPASLLFYQGVAQHWMLDAESGLRSLTRLLERKDELPARYESLATLMIEDLKGLKEESLDHISRRMGDIKRRLELGRAVEKTIEVENGVVESLDKLIKDLEEKQQQQQASASSAPITPASPARDSLPLGGKGRGEVVKKDIGRGSGWGDLPPRERQEALQGMSKNLPSHYREVIESYFKRLAGDNTDRSTTP